MPLRREEIEDQLREFAETLRLGRSSRGQLHSNLFQHSRQRHGEREERPV
jgi:hypothetical protein